MIRERGDGDGKHKLLRYSRGLESMICSGARDKIARQTA
jgi:hypothetical protein